MGSVCPGVVVVIACPGSVAVVVDIVVVDWASVESRNSINDFGWCFDGEAGEVCVDGFDVVVVTTCASSKTLILFSGTVPSDVVGTDSLDELNSVGFSLSSSRIIAVVESGLEDVVEVDKTSVVVTDSVALDSNCMLACVEEGPGVVVVGIASGEVELKFSAIVEPVAVAVSAAVVETIGDSGILLSFSSISTLAAVVRFELFVIPSSSRIFSF